MEDYKILPRLRRGRVLSPAKFGCLEGIPSLNITSGCLFQCSYCYARGYSQTPKGKEVYLYINLPKLLEEELSKKRKGLQWVILNTSSDSFQSHPDILRVTYEVIRILLEHGIGISFLTKGLIPNQFIELFKESSANIFAQIGLVSLSEAYWKEYEKGTPSPLRRLENIKRLREIGILPEVRIDPIIPFITDTEFELKRLFSRLKEYGIMKTTISYLHLRPSIEKQLIKELSPLHQKLIESCFRTQDWKEVGSSTKTKLLPKSLREKGYQRIKEIADEFGISASICRCKNPDLEGDLCGSGRPKMSLSKRTPKQLPLFQC